MERGDRGVCADIGGAQRWGDSAQFSPDGTNIVSASDDQTVRVWSVATGECADIGGAQRLGVLRSLARMARISYRRVTTGLCACGAWRQGMCADIEGHSSWVYSAQFSPDGTNIVSASEDETVRVWSVATGSVCRHWRAQRWGGSAQFSPDGTNIVSASYRQVRVWSGDRGVCADIGGAQRWGVFCAV